MLSRFVHLHVHSHFSLLEALPKVKALLGAAKKQKMDALALTDNGVLYGVIDFYEKAREAGVKPIIGMDAYLAPDGRLQKRARIDAKPNRLVLLAETNEGYTNLIKLSSIGFLEGFYYKPRIDKEVLRQHAKGLIALSGGHQGEIETMLSHGDETGAEKLIQEYLEIFSAGNFFLEIVDRPEIAEQEAINAKLIELGGRLGVPVVATKNTFYLKPTDMEAWKILNCIKGGKTLEDFERLQPYEYDASLVSGEYMENRFKNIPEAIENTRKIADRCNVTLELGKWNFADYKIPEGKTFRQVLTEKVYAELPKKAPAVTEEMKRRIEYELDIIDQKGFCPYFLIVSDYIQWAREHGIVTTTRGSAAGSLVSYAVGISDIDPLQFELPFERFLNPERPSAPDIDADFADNRRDEVLAYVTEKYGHDKVAQICTFGTMMARGSVRDVGRGLGLPYGFVDRVAKMIPFGSQGFAMTLTRALNETPELKKLYDTDAQVRRVIDLALQIEGCARHVSIHAAGVVISPSALTDFTPIQIDTKEGKVITQYEMKTVESAGLVKMDFLGIRNLSILGDAVALVKKIKGIDVDLQRIPFDDKKTFELLANGHTMGVFQLGGEGMTKYLTDLKPERVEDIMAMVALYRPGPIESIPEYIKRKHDPKLIRYLDPRMKDILDKSYGVIVYQDDVMLMAIKLAGYSWLEADKLRKAMGKKIPAEMAKQKEKLLYGFVQHGLSDVQAHELWKLIEPFAAYGFNKAHAASYGMVAYQTAYMKANFPAEYMTALMTAESADLEKIAEAVTECKRIEINVLPPDLNESLANFTYINDRTIRFGLLAIKNLGEEVINSIIEERRVNGPFQDLADFARRITHRAFNKKALESLIKSGALDRFGERKQLLENIERILMYNKHAEREREQNQKTLFELSPGIMEEKLALNPSPPADMRELLAWEKELLGLYVSANPYLKVAEKLKAHLTPCAKVASCAEGAFVRCGGLVSSVKVITTKKGEAMAFVGLDDTVGKTEVIVFPRAFADYKDLLVVDRIVLVSAKVSKREGEEAKLLANSLMAVEENELDELEAMLKEGKWVAGGREQGTRDREQEGESEQDLSRSLFPVPRTPPPGISIALRGRPSPETIEQLRELFQSHPGTERVCFLVESGGRLRRVETDYTMSSSPEIMDDLAAIVGRQNVMRGAVEPR
jgi:DNA polymerase-3 subunit alpha